jgi:dTDP-4-amino-4,6-dideoxygalactose transaminase
MICNLPESDPFHVVEMFENTISNFYGAKYGIATDSCTHAIELCMRYENLKYAKIPEHTYISIPFTCEKLGINWEFEDDKWEEYYFIKGTNIIDGAVMWKKNSYISGTYLCLSFQYKKHLSIGKGGIILTDNKDSYHDLQKMSYDGRLRGIPWGKQKINTIGYHYYMTPESAKIGLNKFNEVKNSNPKIWSYLDYPNLSNMEVFKK